MFTVCSKCNLRLTVTATDLRAAQGYVRCGRCHNVFNALAALADEPARPPDAPSTSDTQSRLALTPAPEPEPAPQPPPEPEAAAEHDTSLEFNPASTNIYEVFIEASPGDHRTGTFEAIVLASDEPAAANTPAEPVAPQTDAAAVAPPAPAQQEASTAAQPERAAVAEPEPTHAPATPEEVAPEAATAQPVAEVVAATADAPTPVLETPPVEAAPTEAPVDAVADEAPAHVAATPEPPAPEAPAEAAEPTGTADTPAAAILAAIQAIDAPEPAAAASDATPFVDATAADAIISAMDMPVPLLEVEPAAPRVPRWALQGACVALVLCLLVQVVHHYRSELADTALLRRPLTALYQALGQPLEVRWDILNYEIRQLGASTDGAAAGDLVVRASISNRASRDQPLPLLRVVMQDRFGNRVAARDLAPTEYLGRGAPHVSLMAPGQRVDVQVAFQDPGQSATGFEIDACMASRDHTVTCANDPGTH